MHNWRFKAAALAAVPVLFLTACGDDDEASDGGSDGGSGNTEGFENLSGSILIDGSSTVAPLGEAAAELFMEATNNSVEVSVGTSGTGGGFEKFCNGETDVSEASRPIKDEEAEICESNGIGFDQIQVANDALTVMVHPDNPIDCITVEQLNEIWAPGSEVENWNDVEGLDFGEKLELYGPGTDSGTFDYFTEAINGAEGEQRTNYNDIGENDNAGITGVTGSPGGMFYVGFSYFMENQDAAKALEIDGGDGCVAPSFETVQDGTYTPLARGLFQYPSDAALERPEVVAFYEFFMENQAEIAEAAGFIGMTEEQAAESAEKVASLATD